MVLLGLLRGVNPIPWVLLRGVSLYFNVIVSFP